MADEGKAEANERLAADPADGGGLALAIGIAVADGDETTAKDDSARLIAAFPESADAWDIRGGVLSMESGDATARESQAAFDRALAIDPKHVDALINRGEQAEPTDPDAAERFLKRAVEARPASTDANDAWTTFLIGQNRTTEALTAYDAWLGKQPSSPIALMGKATVLADEGRYDEALWLVQNVVRDDTVQRRVSTSSPSLSRSAGPCRGRQRDERHSSRSIPETRTPIASAARPRQRFRPPRRVGTRRALRPRPRPVPRTPRSPRSSPSPCSERPFSGAGRRSHDFSSPCRDHHHDDRTPHVICYLAVNLDGRLDGFAPDL